MAVNQLIARGVAPIGQDLPQIGNMLFQRDQAQQQNALAQQGMQNDATRANAFAQQVQGQQQNAEETRARQMLQQDFDNVASNPQLLPQFLGLLRSTVAPELPENATLPEIALRLQLAMPQQAVPFDQTPEAAKIRMQGEQAMALERQRAANAAGLERIRQAGASKTPAAGPAAPTGYRWKPDGSMEPVPGGPADAKLNPPKKLSDAKDVLGIIAIAEPLLDKATGSFIGAAVDKGAQAFGRSTDGGVAVSQLKALQAALMLKMPRMEGPQSNLDVQLYREAAGTIGDPTVPAANKRAALEVVKQLNQQYTNGAGRPGGASGGWSVVEVK